MPIDMLDLVIKLDSSEFDKVMGRINEEISNIKNAAEGISSGVQQIVSSIPDTMNVISEEMDTLFNDIAEKCYTTVEEMVNNFVEFKDMIADEVLEEFKTVFAESFDMMFEDAGAAWQHFTNGIKNIFSNLWKSVSDMLKKALEDMIAQELIAYAKEKAIAAGRVVLNAVVGATDAASKDVNPYTKIATGLAVFAGIMAIGAKLAGAFAQGGIVSGASFSGDNMLARVNSGEMILNRQQQANLWNMANGMSSAAGAAGIEITQNINIENGTDIESITDALRRGTLEALEFANLTVRVGNKQSELAV